MKDGGWSTRCIARPWSGIEKHPRKLSYPRPTKLTPVLGPGESQNFRHAFCGEARIVFGNLPCRHPGGETLQHLQYG